MYVEPGCMLSMDIRTTEQWITRMAYGAGESTMDLEGMTVIDMNVVLPLY